MKNLLFIVVASIFCFAMPAQAETAQDIWAKYSSMAKNKPSEKAQQEASFPGRIIGDVLEEHKAYFTQAWKMRGLTYELYFASSTELAQSVYDLALFSKDIDESLAMKTFLNGVLGFHYTSEQVLDWAKSLYKKDMPASEYPYLIRFMLEDKVLTLHDTGFQISPNIRHILAASAGKKRTFYSTLEHERLHVFWDEDTALREKQIAKWHALSDAEKSKIRKELHRYAQGNEAQLIEEWSVHSTESSNFEMF